MTLINNEIDRLFVSVLSTPDGQVCENPVTGGRFVKGEGGEDSITYQKENARKVLIAREWFAFYGPRCAPPLPVTPEEWEEMRHDFGLKIIIGFYARSLSFRDWRVHDHPSFDDFARGLMVFIDLRARAGQQPLVAKMYSPRPLVGMTPGAYWAPPDECKKIAAEHQRAGSRSLPAKNAA